MSSAALLICAYLLGSLSGSLILGRMRGVDIRALGSGNAGGTNALRTQGARFALATIVIDVGKGALAVWLARRAGSDWLPFAAAAAAVAGHVWPVFHRFRGGKGAATLFGATLLLWPFAAGLMALAWLLLLVTTGYAGLATIVAAAAMVPMALFDTAPAGWPAFAAAMAVFIAWTHRANLARLRAGSENRFERARLFARRRRPA